MKLGLLVVNENKKKFEINQKGVKKGQERYEVLKVASDVEPKRTLNYSFIKRQNRTYVNAQDGRKLPCVVFNFGTVLLFPDTLRNVESSVLQSTPMLPTALSHPNIYNSYPD